MLVLAGAAVFVVRSESRVLLVIELVDNVLFLLLLCGEFLFDSSVVLVVIFPELSGREFRSSLLDLSDLVFNLMVFVRECFIGNGFVAEDTVDVLCANEDFLVKPFVGEILVLDTDDTTEVPELLVKESVSTPVVEDLFEECLILLREVLELGINAVTVFDV